ncbi:unnamed protein product [Rodentolepis nana]|uniref:Uncharacterized protein n=1 Tax=Rodentolepis nana TaxID=102285 RepID=A0A0R3TEY2_RODNA|nr:unnamed protein product [Rodentolepis nana]
MGPQNTIAQPKATFENPSVQFFFKVLSFCCSTGNETSEMCTATPLLRNYGQIRPCNFSCSATDLLKWTESQRRRAQTVHKFWLPPPVEIEGITWATPLWVTNRLKSLRVTSGLQRHWLDESGQSDSKINSSSADSTQSLDAPNGAESGGVRQRALSDPRAPGLSLFFQQTPSNPQTSVQQRDQPPSTPSVRHSVAFFDTPATPRLAIPPSTPLLSATPVSIKDKNRAIFDLPLIVRTAP